MPLDVVGNMNDVEIKRLHHLQSEYENLEYELAVKTDLITFLVEERDKWIRAFNRLEVAITHHQRDCQFPDNYDDALYIARSKILTDLHNTE